MARVWIGIGSNLGDREHRIRQAISVLHDRFTLRACSPVYESKPAYVEAQPDFLNLVCEIETALPPAQVLDQLKQTEVQLGRTPSFRYGPRLIDLDLLFYDDQVIEIPGLTVPHPRLTERAFVLAPLLDLAPEWIHPQLGLSVRELYTQLGDVRDRVWLYGSMPWGPDR